MIRLKLNFSLSTSQYAFGTDVQSQIKIAVRAPSQTWLTKIYISVHILFISYKQVLIQSFLFILIAISSIHPSRHPSNFSALASTHSYRVVSDFL